MTGKFTPSRIASIARSAAFAFLLGGVSLAQADIVNLTGSSIRVGGAGGMIYTSTTSAGLVDATDGAGTVLFSTQYNGSGSGVYTALFRVQNNGNEQGYNSYASGSPPMDQKNGVGDPELIIGPVTGTTINELYDGRINIGGEEYYQFTLDLNEDQSTGRWISLDNVALYTTSRTTDPKYTSLAAMNADPQLTPVWRMDFGSTNQAVLLNANLTPGSGNDNMIMAVPVSMFASFPSTNHVYFYTQFGVFNTNFGTTEFLNGSTWQSNSFVTEATFEEWSLYTEGAIPEPTTAAFVVLSSLTLVARRRRTAR